MFYYHISYEYKMIANALNVDYKYEYDRIKLHQLYIALEELGIPKKPYNHNKDEFKKRKTNKENFELRKDMKQGD